MLAAHRYTHLIGSSLGISNLGDGFFEFSEEYVI